MATLKRSDILKKHVNRGRPPKPAKERLLKQRAAYQWRDARRIYLAGSFDRWRKLKSRLQLKDSSLAWHLLEAHDKGCYNCSMPSMVEDNSSVEMAPHHKLSSKRDSSEFFPALQKQIRQLCYTYLQFEDCAEVVGLICVEIDHKSKDSHSIKEVVRRGLVPKERAHERSQSELEASEAESVNLAMNKLSSKDEHNTALGSCDGLIVSKCQAISPQNAVKCVSSVVPVSDIVPSSHPSVGVQDNGGRMDEDGGGERLTPGSVCRDKLELDNQNLESDSQLRETAIYQNSDSQINEGHNQTACNYDEIDQAPQTSTHQSVDHSVGTNTNTNISHTLPASLWHPQNRSQSVICISGESPTHSPGGCISYTPGEMHKVVVSDEGIVSHVVQNGPTSGQVYRIDLSNHGHNTNSEVAMEVQENSGTSVEFVHRGGEERRERSESMESTDSFMEVGILSQINHAQRLLASPSPTDQPSPETSFVSNPTLPVNHDTLPAHPPDSVSAHVSLSTETTQVASEHSFHPSHTSVIKQVAHNETSDLTSSTGEAYFPSGEKKASSSARVSVNEGDLPLDMSVVRGEEDNMSENLEDTRKSVNTDAAAQDQQPASQDAEPEDVCQSSDTQQSDNAENEAPTSLIEPSQLFPAASSVQLLQNYTELLLQQHQQQQLKTDLSSVQMSSLALKHDDATRVNKRKLSELDDSRDGEMYKGNSWPRKDMTQKEEYQYLETDPFMDFAEMTRIFPNMQQRTFYRWKRKIKDQFIFLEQQPSLTFSQFSQYFPQVREHVFEHWRELLTQGHRFLGDAGRTVSSLGDGGSLLKTSSGEEGSTTPKDGESGTPTDNFVAQYIFLQKNPNMDAAHFAKLFPDVPQDLLYLWKKQIFSDFLKLRANPKMTYQEFRKQASVAQDVYSIWKAHLTLMTNPSHLMSTCNNLVSASSSLSAAAPTLPPVSLLAAHTTGKTIGTDLAAWYASYSPLMGQMTLPFWSPLSIISNPALSTQFTGLRDSSSVDCDQTPEKLNEKLSELERLGEKDLHRRRTASESSKLQDLGMASLLDKVGEMDGNSSPHTSEGGGNGEGSVGHRGRRQSLKPEHYYYLLNPDTTYLALTRVFPSVSAQRYGRWRRKVTSALALLEREPACSDDQFALYFPNVPDEILSSWRERVRQGHSRLMVGSHDLGEEASQSCLTQPSVSQHQTNASPGLGGYLSRDSSLGPEANGTLEEVPNFLTEKPSEANKSSEDRLRDLSQSESQSLPSSRKQFKMNREEFLFIQRYPSVDFSTFTTYYPSISVRTFYRWRRQIRDAIDLLRTNPSLTLQEFKEQFPEVNERFPELTDEVFEAWRTLVVEESQYEREAKTDTEMKGEEEKDDGVQLLSNSSLLQQPHTETTGAKEAVGQQGHESHQGSGEAADSSQLATEQIEERAQCRNEQMLVHMNPYIDYAELQRTYPHVTQRTFFRWKTDVRHVMDYMRKHPDVAYEDISSAVPDISFKAFNMWQQLILEENRQAQTVGKTDTESGSQYVVKTPETNGTSHVSNSALAENKLTTLSNDGFAPDNTDDRSKALADESLNLVGSEGDEHHTPKARRQTRDEFIEIMLNPAMDYPEFARRIGTVSQRTFYRWRAHIRDWRVVIRNNPDLDYATFSRTARDVPEYVFQVWREWESRSENGQTGNSGEEVECSQHESSQSSVIQSEPQPAVSSTANVSESSKPRVSQLQLLWEAHDYYQKHPLIDFEGLSALYPSVSMDMFQQWKKSVDVRMEYIRSIPSTNFEDFHRLFPDVKENIFNILKACVLGQVQTGDTMYLPQSVESDSSTSFPTPQLISASHSVFPQTLANRTGAELHESESGAVHSSHRDPYSSVKSGSVQSLHQQASPVLAGKEVLNVITPAAVHVKQESSPNTPLPSFTETVSNLSNLSRLNAMFQNSLPQTSPAVSSVTPPSTVLYPHSVITTSTASVGDSFSTTLAGMVGQTLSKVAVAPNQVTDQALLSARAHLYPSLSVLGSPDMMNPVFVNVENSDVSMSKVSKSGAGGEDTPVQDRTFDTSLVHSSQRQRKLQREEYIFVEQNPDVDVQEFLSRFPKVSLRTFYRWKREIREEQQAKGSTVEFSSSLSLPY